MKKTILSLACIFLTGIIFGQTLSKGNILGVHVLNEFELQPGVTMEQFEEFWLYNDSWEDFNNRFEDIKMYPLKGIRGEHGDILGFLWYLDSDDVRNKYWAQEGVFSESEAGQAITEFFPGWQQELLKYINLTGDQFTLYTDWEIQ